MVLIKDAQCGGRGKGGEDGRRLGDWGTGLAEECGSWAGSREAGDAAGSANLLLPTLSWSVRPMSDDWRLGH